MSGGLNGANSLDNQWGGDFVYLTISERGDHVFLKPTSFVGVAGNPSLFKVAPKAEGVFECVTEWRLLPKFFSFPSGDLLGFSQRDFRKVPDGQICYAAERTDTQYP